MAGHFEFDRGDIFFGAYPYFYQVQVKPFLNGRPFKNNCAFISTRSVLPVSVLSSRDVMTQILCVIGQGSLSRPMVCLRCRSAYLRIFFVTIVAMVSEAFKPRVRFSKAIYIIKKYCIDIMIDLIS